MVSEYHLLYLCQEIFRFYPKIETGFKLEGSKLTNYKGSLFQRREDQCICAGHWVHDDGTTKFVRAAFDLAELVAGQSREK